MLAQRVRLAGEARRRAHLGHRPLDAVELRDPAGDRRRTLLPRDLALEQRELAVPPVHAGAVAPADDLRQQVDERHQHDEQRHHENDRALDERRRPERQFAVEKAAAEAVVAQRVGGNAQVDLRGAGELAGPLEIALVVVDVVDRLQQQVDERRVQAVARRKHRLGADHRDRLRRDVAREVDRAGRQGQPHEEGKPPLVRLGTREAHQPQLRVAQRALDQRRGRAADQQRGVGAAGGEQVDRRVGGCVDQRCVVRVDAIGGEQRDHERARAAPRHADGDPLAAQLEQLRDRRVAAKEDPQRLVIQAREHHELVGRRTARDAALHECDVDPRLRIEEQLVVLAGALRLADVDRHPLAGEQLAVAQRVLVVEAARRTGGEHDPPRRHGLQQLEREPERGADRDGEQQHGPQEVAAREQDKFAE